LSKENAYTEERGKKLFKQNYPVSKGNDVLKGNMLSDRLMAMDDSYSMLWIYRDYFLYVYEKNNSIDMLKSIQMHVEIVR